MITTSQKARLCGMAFIPESNIPILLLLVQIFGYKKAAETFTLQRLLTVSDNFFVL